MSKLLLIQPTFHRKGIKRVQPFWMPPLGLATLAGSVDESWDIQLVDENVEDIDFTIGADLVGISCLTANAYRGYEIASEFRKRGCTVFLGGAHVSICSEEALQYADTVVVGDAEGCIKELLKDFKNNSLQSVYHSEVNEHNMKLFAPPRRDLYNESKYLSINTIQTTRGCPHDCTFCSIASRYHRKYETKSINCVIDEIKELKNKKNPIFFVDDNILVDKIRANQFLDKLQDLEITWWSQTDINTVQDEEFLKKAKASGCINLVIGFESLSQDSVTSMSKFQNRVDNYAQTIEKLHRKGIFVNPSFAFGVDGDYEDVFEKTFDFLTKQGVAFATFNILTPLPGTKLYKQFLETGRIIDEDWSHYDMGHPVFIPKNMSPQVLKDGHEWICKKFYSMDEIYKRIKLLRTKSDLFDLNLVLGWNLGYKRMVDAFGIFM